MRQHDMFLESFSLKSFPESFLKSFPESVFHCSGDVQLHQIWARRRSGDQECHLCSRVEHDQWQGVTIHHILISSYFQFPIFVYPHAHIPISTFFLIYSYLRCLPSYGSGTASSSLPGWTGILLSFPSYPYDIHCPFLVIICILDPWYPHVVHILLFAGSNRCGRFILISWSVNGGIFLGLVFCCGLWGHRSRRRNKLFTIFQDDHTPGLFLCFQDHHPSVSRTINHHSQFPGLFPRSSPDRYFPYLFRFFPGWSPGWPRLFCLCVSRIIISRLSLTNIFQK